MLIVNLKEFFEKESADDNKTMKKLPSMQKVAGQLLAIFFSHLEKNLDNCVILDMGTTPKVQKMEPIILIF